ncbi:hypothetical protein L328_0122990 [Yersinia pestis 24H]|nr:hypothetical protein L328_0122990 [Yersinia pestis 24H]
MNSSFESLIEQYPLPIAEQLRHWAARYASRIAVVDAKGSLTYSALDAQVDELAAGLSSLGLRSGEHVIVQLPNDNAFVTLLFALLRLGVIPVLAMPSQRALDIDALIELAQPVAYVIHGENHARAGPTDGAQTRLLASCSGRWRDRERRFYAALLPSR